MNKKVKVALIIIIGLCIICSSLILFINSSVSNEQAIVYVNNEVYMTLDLSDQIYREYTVETEYGVNVITVSGGAVCVSEADCPDKTCVKTGFTDSPAKPVICMPHRLQIIVCGSNTDGAAR